MIGFMWVEPRADQAVNAQSEAASECQARGREEEKA